MAQHDSLDKAAADIERSERLYPWRKWLAGGSFDVTRQFEKCDNSEGSYFFSTPLSFIAMLRARAAENSKKVSVRSGKRNDVETIAFTFYEVEEVTETVMTEELIDA